MSFLMKNAIITLILILSYLQSQAQIVNIPDPNFKAYLLGDLNINTNADGEIQVSEAAAATYVTCQGLNISDLTGIEAFTNINTLYCFNNQIANLDLSQNAGLIWLYCDNNLLTDLDISANPLITRVRCFSNMLTQLDLNNGNNTNFDLIDTRNNPNLSCINVDEPTYSTLNWLPYPGAFDFDATHFFAFDCNAITCPVYIPDAAFKNKLLSIANLNINGDSEIQCHEAARYTDQLSMNPVNNITDMTGIEAFIGLSVLGCDDNQITELDLSKNKALEVLYCENNPLTSLNLANGNNHLMTDLHVYNNPNLTCIRVDDPTYCNANWTGPLFLLDPHHLYCPPLPSIHYVDASATGANDGTSWANAFTDLQSALAVSAGEFVHIAEGTYYPTSGTSRGVSFSFPDAVTILGGFPTGGGDRDPTLYETILSGDIDGDGTFNGNSFHVVKVQNANNVVVDGITVTRGSADNQNSFGRARGGGLYVIESTVNFINVTTKWNKAIYGGGFFGTLSPNVTFEKSELKNNIADFGSAMYHSNETNLYIYRTRIFNNNSLVRCAIEINNSNYTLIEHSVIANNASTNANAIAFIATNRDQSCDINHCTILGETKNKNLITFQIGYGDQLDVNMNNTIVAHQDLSFTRNVKAFNNNILNFIHKNCYFQGSSVIGTGILTLFSDTAGDLLLNPDYSVMPCSPVVNAGNNSLVTSSVDIDENPRIVNSTVDIGAYETQISCKKASDKPSNKMNNSDLVVFPNPTNGLFFIRTKMELEYTEIFDMKGQLLLTTTEKEIQLENHPFGIYLARIFTKDGSIIQKKIIIQN